MDPKNLGKCSANLLFRVVFGLHELFPKASLPATHLIKDLMAARVFEAMNSTGSHCRVTRFTPPEKGNVNGQHIED